VTLSNSPEVWAYAARMAQGKWRSAPISELSGGEM
jgi:hypothetical protein